MLDKLLSELKIKGAARFIWAALLVGLMSNAHTQEWANAVYAQYSGTPLYYGDMQWFICCYVIVIILIAAVDVENDLVICKIAIALVFGKIADLFTCPFWYGANEFILDIMLGCIGLMLWLKRIGIRRIVTNFIYDIWKKNKVHNDSRAKR